MNLPATTLPAICAIALATTGCAKKLGEPRIATADQAVRTLSAWPQGHTQPLKITDALTLEIPLQYERSAISHDQSATRALISQQSDRSEARFDFFLPDFTGYTLENYRNESDENRVEVIYLHAGDAHEADPDAPGEYPPNMLKRSLKDLLNPNDYQDMYGLRCYQGRARSERITCYGRRDAASKEDIMLNAAVPPYSEGVTLPLMQARYFSTRYGGVRIAWRTHVRNFSRWREIDAQIWKFIDAWNVARAPDESRRAGRPEAKGGG